MRLITIAGLVLAVAAAAAAAPVIDIVSGVPHVRSTSSIEGAQLVELQELWRAGGADDEENFFGVPTEAVAGPDGRVYLLDTQLATIHIYESDGTFAGTVGRDGDGPGEFRFPTGMVRLPGQRLAVTAGMGGKIVVVNEDGTPSASITPGDEAAGGFQSFFDVKARGEHLVLCGAQMAFADGGMKERRYLASYDAATEGFATTYWELSGVRDMSKPKFIEKDEYFAANRYDVDAEGRVYVADNRDAYSVSVYGPDGGLERVIERPDYAPHVRTDDEKADVTSGMVIMTGNGRLEIENVVEDAAPAIDSLFLDDDGLLWVMDGHAERHEGVYRRYDVFAADGAWLRTVDIVLPGNNEEDGLMPLGDGRFLHVIGLSGAAEAMQAGVNARHGGDGAVAGDDLGEGDPLEVICYRL